MRLPRLPRPQLGVAPPADAAAAGEAAQRTLQVVWWMKVLRDDPLRVLRAPP